MSVVIIGAGVTGLSAAHHLKKNYLILEKNTRVGGLAASDSIKGFVFDKTGHLLHMHFDYTKNWIIKSLLKDKLALRQRDAWIFSKNAFTRYPFQANTFGLPNKVIAECVVSFLKERDKKGPRDPDPTFHRWCQETFGAGTARHFMSPYNKKLWQWPLERMTTEWIRNFIPVPSREEVLYGALTDQKKFFGYNATFYYPKEGGIELLPNAIANELEGEVILGCEVLNINTEKKEVTTTQGAFSYDWLVNTAPLNEFLSKLEPPLPEPIKNQMKSALHHTVVYNLNLGLRQKNATPKHWTYFPENKYPFYRVGAAHNFSNTLAPPDCGSYYVEFAGRPEKPFDFKKAANLTLKAFRELDFMSQKDEVAVSHWNVIDPGYVIFTKERREFLPQIFKYLESRQILTAGRYGAWKYSFMEECLMDGKSAAEKILARK